MYTCLIFVIFHYLFHDSIISVSPSISIVSRALMLRNIHLDHMYVFLSVCLFVRLQSVLWQNASLDWIPF